ncbi:MAG: helix-turn-helix domain-containing protein [bacterium]|nr:helix-turn-helix domain-containing protein [bacterium]
MEKSKNKDRLILAQRIRQLREQLGLSQQDLADQAGLSRVHISGLERGVSSPAVESLIRIAKVLQTTAGELLKDIEFTDEQTVEYEPTKPIYPALQELLNDTEALMLYNITPQEIAILKSIRFQNKNYEPTRQFFLDTLLDIRRRKNTS